MIGKNEKAEGTFGRADQGEHRENRSRRGTQIQETGVGGWTECPPIFSGKARYPLSHSMYYQRATWLICMARRVITRVQTTGT